MLFCFIIGDISFDHMVKNESCAGFGSRKRMKDSIKALFHSIKYIIVSNIVICEEILSDYGGILFPTKHFSQWFKYL